MGRNDHRVVFVPRLTIHLITAETVLPIPFDSFMICFDSRHRKAEVAYTMISLLYGKTIPNSSCFRVVTPTPFSEDSLAFSVMLFLAGRWRVREFGIPSLLATIVRDATVYFLVIFSAHFVFAMTIFFTRVSSLTCFVNCIHGKGVSLALDSIAPRPVSHSSSPLSRLNANPRAKR